ncbi:MAG TPA: AraC family transcriptional regulator [Ruminococcaceae bacterium]|nr:AraC family transcriptional regulator [Oscillospiraceae bacterium]
MKIDINKLAEHFARTPFQVETVYHAVQKPGDAEWQMSSPFPGFIFPLCGKARFQFEDTPYLAKMGSIIHGGANMSLDKKVVGNAKWEYILVLYKIVAPEPEGMTLSEAHFELQVGESPCLIELLHRLHQVYRQPGGIMSFHVERLFRDILDEMFFCARNQTNGGAQALFEQVAAYIHEHYSESLTIPSLAAQSGVNKNRVAYVFYKYAGMGPGDYILQYRLKRAQELLMVSRAPLRELAQAVGFNDPFYLSKAFKKQFGISPSEFRKQFINNTC